jgi:hypothetical protein
VVALEVEVVLVDPGAELHLLHHDHFLLLLRLVLLLFLLEQVLPVVHHLADGRLRGRGNLDQIEQLLLGQRSRLGNGYDPELLSGVVDETDLDCSDLVIDTGVVAPSLRRGESVETSWRSDLSILL